MKALSNWHFGMISVYLLRNPGDLCLNPSSLKPSEKRKKCFRSQLERDKQCGMELNLIRTINWRTCVVIYDPSQNQSIFPLPPLKKKKV